MQGIAVYIEVTGHGLHTIGAIMVAFTAIQVHMRVWREHKIDRAVYEEMRHERRLGIVGVALMLLGFLIQLPLLFL